MDTQDVNLLPFKVGATLKSMRNSDFDVYTAVCEVIDNSITAKAKNIGIKIDMHVPPGKRKPVPERIAFGDDGTGMDSETLQQCLVIGYSQRYNDRKGIGRFGVGMTYGAINVCQRIEVYSRENRGNWNYTRLDISQAGEDTDPELHPVERKELPPEYEGLVGDFGTLVIWDKIDRVDTDFKQGEMAHRIGRIYRKFIGQQVIEGRRAVKNLDIIKITINNDIVSSHDPLYATRTLKFPKDETAKIIEDIQIDWGVHDVDAPPGGEQTGKITIRMSLLPESWRMQGGALHAEQGYGHAGSGISPENNRRRVFANEGLSVLRNGREVYYGGIRGIGPASKPLDRFWGCEIDFDPVLDRWFSVKNIKIGARPLVDLKKELNKTIRGVILNKLRKEISERFSRTDTERDQERTGPVNRHGAIEDVAREITPKPKEEKPISEDEAERKKDGFPGSSEEQEEYKKKLLSDMPYMVTEDNEARSDGRFIDMVFHLGKQEVRYNRQHPFFVELFRRFDLIESVAQRNDPADGDLIRIARELRVDIDRLLYAYANAYDHPNAEKEQRIEHTMEDHLETWSKILRRTYSSRRS